MYHIVHILEINLANEPKILVTVHNFMLTLQLIQTSILLSIVSKLFQSNNLRF